MAATVVKSLSPWIVISDADPLNVAESMKDEGVQDHRVHIVYDSANGKFVAFVKR